MTSLDQTEAKSKVIAQDDAELIALRAEVAQLRHRLGELEERAAQELREVEARLEAVFNSGLQVIIFIGADGRIKGFNQAASRNAQKFFGKSIELGDAIDLFIRREDAASFVKHFQKALAGQTIKIEKSIKGFAGPSYWFEFSYIPVMFEKQVTGVCFIVDPIDEHKRVEESLAQRNRELALLNDASQAFISTLDLDEILNAVLEEVRRLLNVVACSVWLIDPLTDELVCRQVTDPHSDLVRGWRLAPGQGLAGWAVRHGQSRIVDDVHQERDHFKGVDQQTGLPLRSILTVPLRVKKGVIGVLQVVDETVGRFSEADQRLVESLAVTAASAIENAQLYEQAQRDAETKAMLLREVNHRVKNNLAAIIGLLYAERRHAGMENQATYQAIMKNLINRVQGLATVHSLLSASGWSPLPLTDVATQVIHSSLKTLLPDKRLQVNVAASPVRVSAKQANSLALVINELATNTVKHGIGRRDTVRIDVSASVDHEVDPSAVCFQFRDDGPGYPAEVLQIKQHSVGLYLIQAIVQTDLQGELSLENDGGAVTTIRFQLIE